MNLADALAQSNNQPAASLAAFGALAQDISGCRLVTLMTFDIATREARRAWTSDPENYPVSGTKPINEDKWTAQVLDQHKTFVANDINSISEVFADYALIQSLGCESCMNLPFVANGQVLGTVNMLDAANYFTPQIVQTLEDTLRLPGIATFLLNKSLTSG